MSLKTLIFIVVIVGVISFATWMVRGYLLSTTTPSSCDLGVSGAKHAAMTHRGGPSPNAGDAPLIDDTRPIGSAPAGMVWIPAGEFSMGSDEEMFTDARPIHRVKLDGFWMDKTEVTNAQFAEFVAATGYVTVAESKPRQEDFPGVPPEKLVAGSIVFTPPKDAVPLNDYMQWWAYVEGANWRHPEGPNSDLKGRDKHPVAH